MKYRFDVDSWGGHFSVPCSVATEYLKTSDGNYLKVLLCILSSATRDIESQSITQATGLDEDIIEDAIVHWTSLGVLKLVGQSESTIPATAVQVDDKTVPVSTVESIKPTSKAVDRKIVVSYTVQEINEKAQKDPELKHLFDEIQGYINNTINGKELGMLTDLYETYHYDVPTILIAAEYCNTLGKYSVHYLSKLLMDWSEHDLCTYDEVEAEIIRRTEYNTYESTVRRCFGLTNKLSTKQKEYVENWDAREKYITSQEEYWKNQQREYEENWNRREEYWKNYKKEAENYKNQAEKYIGQIKSEKEELIKELNGIYNSKVWKLYKRLRIHK